MKQMKPKGPLRTASRPSRILEKIRDSLRFCCRKCTRNCVASTLERVGAVTLAPESHKKAHRTPHAKAHNSKKQQTNSRRAATMTDQSTTTLPSSTLSSSPSQKDGEISRSPTVYKPMDRYSRLYSSPNKQSFMGSPPNSLNRLMANRGSVRSMHSSFARTMESNLRKKKAVNFKAAASADEKTDEVDYGYGEDYGYGDAEPDSSSSAPSKPEAEQPRATEEPAMKRRRYQRRNSKTPAMLMANWDGGLEIAEELVKSLQKRRSVRTTSSTRPSSSNRPSHQHS